MAYIRSAGSVTNPRRRFRRTTGVAWWSTMSDRAQSDVLGFVFVFAIVVATIGLVFSTGFAGLQDARDFERVNNAQRAFEVLKDNVEDVVARGAPSRATEIKLADASLAFGQPVTINVSEKNGSFSTSQEIDPLVYDANTGTEIVYSAGAIVRQQDNGEIVAHPPGFVLTAERTVIPIIQTRDSGAGSVSGDTTVLIRTTVAQRNVLYASEGESTLWVNVTTPRANAWHDHLDDRDHVTCEPVAGDDVACQVETRRVYITRISIDTELD